MDVDDFLKDFTSAIALNAAIKGGVIDLFLVEKKISSNVVGKNPAGALLLLKMLENAQICHMDEAGLFHLTPDFLMVLTNNRLLLEEKLGFLILSAHDLLDGFSNLLFDLPSFMGQSRTFGLFRYDKAWEITPENIEHTRQWINYVAALSEVEAKVILPALSLGNTRSILEIGGNVGAFALHLLAAHPHLKLSILDLPVVCALGEEYVESRVGADRLNFVAGDARQDQWPLIDGVRPDTVMFKSVLHDWPDLDVEKFLRSAIKHLPPGGRIVICERGPMVGELEDGAGPLPFSMTANLVFAPFYRPSEFYEKMLSGLGIENISVTQVKAEMKFNIISGHVGMKT